MTEEIHRKLDEMHGRVFNGLGKELREEIGKEVGKLETKINNVTRIVMSILLALFLVFAGIIVEGRVSSSRASSENDRNYNAIMEIGKKFEVHVATPATVAHPNGVPMIAGGQ